MYGSYKNFLKREAIEVISDIKKIIFNDLLRDSEYIIVLEERVEAINNILAVLDTLRLEQLDRFNEFLLNTSDDIQNSSDYIRASTETYVQVVSNLENQRSDATILYNSGNNNDNLISNHPSIENNHLTIWGHVTTFFGMVMGALFGSHDRVVPNNAGPRVERNADNDSDNEDNNSCESMRPVVRGEDPLQEIYNSREYSTTRMVTPPTSGELLEGEASFIGNFFNH